VRVAFITGTDTGVGKTIVTAALAAVQRSRGRRVAVVKPAQTGLSPGEPGDADEVRRLAGPLDFLEGVRLPDPLAPDRAASLAGVALPSLFEQRDLVLGAAAGHDIVLVEGAGGVLVNLGTAYTLLDLATSVRAVGADVSWYVVARSGLGTLNHSTLTVQAIQRCGLAVEGIVIGAWPDDPDLADRHNRADLPRYTGVPVLGAVPVGAGALAPETFQSLATSWLDLSTEDISPSRY
jgi:dethiobiotin synthase